MTDCEKRNNCNKIVGNPYEWQNPCPCRDYHKEHTYHDLRANPDDLPTEDTVIIIVFKDGLHTVCKYFVDGRYHFGNMASNTGYVEYTDVIAWKSLELFKQ